MSFTIIRVVIFIIVVTFHISLLSSSVEDIMADCPVMLLWRITDRQQTGLHAGAHTDGQDIGHCGSGTGAGGLGTRTGMVAGQIGGYAMAGDRGHVAIP